MALKANEKNNLLLEYIIAHPELSSKEIHEGLEVE